MKVVLLKDVKKLGFAGDILEVAPGYFNAYLAPAQLAVPASASAVLNAQITQAKRVKGREEVAAKTDEIAAMLKGTVLRFQKKISAGKHLYGSVGEVDIAAELKKQAKIDLEKSQIEMPEHIKELGVHAVTVRLPNNVTVKISVEVTEEKEKTTNERKAGAKKMKAKK